MSLRTEVSGVRIWQPPLDPNIRETAFFDLPCSADTQYFALLRSDDRIEFTDHGIHMSVSFIHVPTTGTEVEVESSALSERQRLPVEPEVEDEGDSTDEDDLDVVVDAGYHANGDVDPEVLTDNLACGTNGETQETTAPYSTSHEQLYEVPKATPQALRTQGSGLSEMIQETPGRLQILQQTSIVSRVQDSVPFHAEVTEDPEDPEDPEDHEVHQYDTRLPASGSRARDAIEGSVDSPEMGDARRDAAQTRGPKRKKTGGASSSTPTTRTSKRVKCTEAEALQEDSVGTPLGSSASHGSSGVQRRTSPRVVVSQRAQKDTSPVFFDQPPRILLPSESKILSHFTFSDFLKKAKVKEAKDARPDSFEIFCVDNGADLKKTAKLLTSIVNSKIIVTEDWIVDSAKAKHLLAPGPYLPEALKDRQDCAKVFEGLTIFFTTRLRSEYKKAWDDIKSVSEQAGADVICCAPSKIPKIEVDLYLGAESDPHVAQLQGDGHVVFLKDILPASIIAGTLTLDDKFALPDAGPPVNPASTNRDGGKTKKVTAKKGKGMRK